MNRWRMGPEELERMKFWQFFALLGKDLPEDPRETEARSVARTRRAQDARAKRLANLDPDIKATRSARLASRKERRKAQRVDPEWKAEVRRGKAYRGEGRPDRVADGEIVIHQVGASKDSR